MSELATTFADKIDRVVQRVTPLAYRLRRRSRRLLRRAMRKPRSVAESPNLLPLLIQVLASFTKADGVLLEEEIDSSLGFLRYDYPETVYSELRTLFRQALYEQQDLSAMAQKLAAQLSVERKIMLGVQLYDLISQAGQKQEQVVAILLVHVAAGHGCAGHRHRLSTQRHRGFRYLHLSAGHFAAGIHFLRQQWRSPMSRSKA